MPLWSKNQIQDLASHASIEELYLIGTRASVIGNACPLVLGKNFLQFHLMNQFLQVDDFAIIFLEEYLKRREQAPKDAENDS